MFPVNAVVQVVDIHDPSSRAQVKANFVYASFYGGHMHIGKGHVAKGGSGKSTFHEYQQAARYHGPSKEFALAQALQVRLSLSQSDLTK